MDPITCPVHSSIEPEFHQAYEIFFSTGQDAPGFAEHVTKHPLREDEVVREAQSFAFDLQQAGHLKLAQEIRSALPVFASGIIPGTPEHRAFKLGTARGTPWKPELNIGALGAAIASVRMLLAPSTEVRCENCGQTVRIPGDQSSAPCNQCGLEITDQGDVLRA